MKQLDAINFELLRTRFRQSGLNYKELAASAELSRNTIYNVMNGYTSPSYQVLTRIAYVLDLSYEDIALIFFPNLRTDQGFI